MSSLAGHVLPRKSEEGDQTGQGFGSYQSFAFVRARAFATFVIRQAKSIWLYLVQHQAGQVLGRRHRRLRISETVSLGEKRSVVILEVDGQAFLVGSSGNNISLLATFEPQQHTFQQVLSASFTHGELR